MSFFDLAPLQTSTWTGELYRAPATPNTLKEKKKEFLLRKYEISWEVPHGSRKVWVIGMKTTANIRRFLYDGDVVFNIQIMRLGDHFTISKSTGHRHWINSIEHEHAWETCDLNPLNFLFFS